MLVKNRGGIIWDLPDAEALRRIEHDGFVAIGKKKEITETKTEDNIEVLREKYFEKYWKALTNKKNDIEWIKSKL